MRFIACGGPRPLFRLRTGSVLVGKFLKTVCLLSHFLRMPSTAYGTTAASTCSGSGSPACSFPFQTQCLLCSFVFGSLSCVLGWQVLIECVGIDVGRPLSWNSLDLWRVLCVAWLAFVLRARQRNHDLLTPLWSMTTNKKTKNIL